MFGLENYALRRDKFESAVLPEAWPQGTPISDAPTFNLNIHEKIHLTHSTHLKFPTFQLKVDYSPKIARAIEILPAKVGII